MAAKEILYYFHLLQTVILQFKNAQCPHEMFNTLQQKSRTFLPCLDGSTGPRPFVFHREKLWDWSKSHTHLSV